MSDQPLQQVEQPISHLPEQVRWAVPVTIPPEGVLSAAVPVPPRVWTVFVLYVIVVVAGVFATVTLMLSTGFFRTDARPSSKTMLQDLAERPELIIESALASLIVALAITLLAALLSPAKWTDRLRLRTPAMSAGQIVWAAVGANAIGLIFSMLDALGLLPHSFTLEPLGQAMSNLSGPAVIPALLVIGLMPGLSEEFLFRGYMQTRLSQRWGTRWSILITALLFGAYHMDLTQGLLAVAMGVYLGALAERANSIIPAMVAHATNNTVAVLLSMSIPEPEHPAICVSLLMAGVVIFAFCLHRVLRRGPCLPVDRSMLPLDNTDNRGQPVAPG